MNFEMGKSINEKEKGCWMCKEHTSMHLHHIIPRSNGGENGPLVWLCNDCHEAIHHAATLNIGITQYNDLPDARRRWWSGFKPIPDVVTHGNYLIKMIIDSSNLVKESAYKTVMINIRLSAKHNNIISNFSKIWGISKKETILKMIEAYNHLPRHEKQSSKKRKN